MRSAYLLRNRLFILQAETEIGFISQKWEAQKNSNFDSRSARPLPNIRHLPDLLRSRYKHGFFTPFSL
jgi:hypothetical protein